jgi:elongation factor 1-alpha
LEKLLKTVGYDTSKILFVPTSGYKGDNIVKKSENMKWYTGKTLMEAFDTLAVPEKPIDKPLRLPVQDVYTITGIGTVPVGRVETGILKAGDNVVFEPTGASGEVKTIEMHHEQIPEAKPGDNVGFSVRGVNKTDIKRGDVVGHTSNPPKVAKDVTQLRFHAR